MDSTVIVAALTGACTLLGGILGTTQYHKRRTGTSRVIGPMTADLCKTHTDDIALLQRVTGRHDTKLAVQEVFTNGMIKLFNERFAQVNERIERVDETVALRIEGVNKSLTAINKRLSGGS